MLFGLPSPRFEDADTLRSARFGREVPRKRRGQRGLVVSSPLALLSAGAVLLAAVAYFVTAPDDKHELQLAGAPQQVEPVTVLQSASPTTPAVRRGETYVVVFNNSGITGLARRTSARLSGAGWNVVGDDNWYGTIPATTVYFPPRLEVEAQVLAEDLGVRRVMPAIEPMQMDRLTVILTGDLG